MWMCSSYTEENSKIQILASDKIYRFLLKACPPSAGRVYPPSFWQAVLGKSGCCEEKFTSLIIRDADKALYLMPQGTLSNFCTSAHINANLFFHCRSELFNLVNNVPKVAGSLNTAMSS
jgi:hypothetical protein